MIAWHSSPPPFSRYPMNSIAYGVDDAVAASPILA